MKKYQLSILCGFIDDESVNGHAYGVGSETRRDNVPDNWRCLGCGVSNAASEMAGSYST
ncbi:MAG: rubredoxin [Nitrosomonas sp.]|nr:rubredoxin [Nitrosomonas sp.]